MLRPACELRHPAPGRGAPGREIARMIDGRADAPAADGVDDEQLEVGEIGGEEHPARRPARPGGRPASGAPAERRLERDQRQRQQQPAYPSTPMSATSTPANRLHWLSLHRLAPAGAAGERADPADLVQIEVGGDEEPEQAQERRAHPVDHLALVRRRERVDQSGDGVRVEAALVEPAADEQGRRRAHAQRDALVVARPGSGRRISRPSCRRRTSPRSSPTSPA